MEEEQLQELFVSFLQEIYFDSYPDLIQEEDPERLNYEIAEFSVLYD